MYEFFVSRFFKSVLFTTAFLIYAYVASGQTKAEIDAHKRLWNTPAWADTLTNPLSHQAAAADSGKALYMRMCTVCHGATGKGDGIGAAGLPVQPADHTSAIVQSQTEGALFYELSNGHTSMPAYKNTLTAKQRWELVCFIKTLKKTSYNK
ncbi:MAG TPA: cytochrome c [Bacteroidia bacterium]|nr:cytochrome c [Bacteroidia bacterium]